MRVTTVNGMHFTSADFLGGPFDGSDIEVRLVSTRGWWHCPAEFVAMTPVGIIHRYTLHPSDPPMYRHAEARHRRPREPWPNPYG